MTHDRCLEKEREVKQKQKQKQGRGNDSCHFSDQYFLPCFLCKLSTILFQNNIKLHYYLGKLSWGRLSGENYQRVSA